MNAGTRRRLMHPAACALLAACAACLVLPAAAAEHDAVPWHLQRIGVPQAWALVRGAARAPIAIVDSGIDPFHPELKDKLLPGINTADKAGSVDQFGHGTKMAGIAGSVGAAPLIPVRVTDRKGRASGANIAKGIVWAVDHGARVINLSLDGVVRSAAIREAAEYAHRHGALVVAPSGNCSCRMEMPDTPFILSVAATDERDGVLHVSTTGPFVDLAAPGEQVSTTAMFGVHLGESGTSVASAIVGGVAALMFAANPSLTPDEVRTLLLRTAVDPDGAIRGKQAGAGRVDAQAAVQAAARFVREATASAGS